MGLLWLLSGTISTGLYDCESGFMNWESAWSPAQQEYCCTTMGRGCATTQPATFEPAPTQPPTPPPTLPPTPPPTPPPTAPRPTAPPAPSGPVDPFNCAVDPENTWKADKKDWCCRVHHRGCPQPIAPPMPLPMPVPRPGMPHSSGRVRLSGLTSTSDRGAFQTLAHVCHLPVSDAVATRHNKQLFFFLAQEACGPRNGQRHFSALACERHLLVQSWSCPVAKP